VNAKNGDFVQIFYPMLVEEKAIHIRQAVHKNLPTLRRSADFNNKILKICCLLIKNGFGSVIFNEITDEEMLNIDNIVTNDELLSKIIATHISVHFASTPSGAAVQKYRTYWSNAEEMLTIVGLLPFVIDYSNSEQSGQFRQFIFEDRQNELIYLMREGASSMVHMFKSEQDLQEIFYRRHCFDVNGFMRSSDTDTALEEEVNNTLKRSFDLHQSNKMIVLTKQAFSKPPYLLHNSIDSQNNGLVTNVSSAESDNPTRTCIEFLKGALRKQALVPKGQYLIVKNGENVLEADGQILSNAQILSNIQRFGDNRIDNVDAVQAHAALVNGDLLTFRAVLANNSSRMDTLLNSEVPFDQDVIKLHARIKSWEYWREVLAVADCSSNLDVWEHIGSFSYEDLDLAKRMLQDERVPQAFVLAAFLRMIILQLAKGNLQNLMFLGSAVCDTPIDPQVKANALRLLGTSDICNNEKERFLDYLLISLNNKVPLDNAGIKGLLDRLLQFYPFHYNTSVMGVWYDNCAKLMRQRSLLDYLPSEIRESCIQLMNMDCSLEDTITLIKQNITGNAFDGFTLLHYAASLPNTVFLQQLLAALSAEVTCTSNNNIYQNIADILVATGSEETDNQTALDIAITFCKEDSLRVLCEICALVLRQLDPGKRQQFYDRTIRRALDRISPYSRSIIENVVQAPSEEVTTDLNP
jgi:hypothetical protein